MFPKITLILLLAAILSIVNFFVAWQSTLPHYTKQAWQRTSLFPKTTKQGWQRTSLILNKLLRALCRTKTRLTEHTAMILKIGLTEGMLQKTGLTEHSTYTNLASEITLPYLYITGLAEHSLILQKTGLTEHSTYTNLASEITLPYLYKTGLAEYSATLQKTGLTEHSTYTK